MTDLSTVLPNFSTQQHVRLIPSLEKNLVTTADLITLDCVEIAKRAHLPLLDVKRLCADVVKSLKNDLGISSGNGEGGDKTVKTLRKTGREVLDQWDTISTLDDEMDLALGGGIPTGYITEITGESGAGKTQFLLTLLLSAQLSAPHGLGAPTLYISTESSLPTTRLSQLLRTHPYLSSLASPPTLDRIHSIVTPDLESQDHILRFQVPVVIQRYGIKLLVLDSVAANYRAEFERDATNANGKRGVNMAHRSAELMKLGQLLRDMARNHGIAVVVANQVADRFAAVGSGRPSPALGRREGYVANSSPLAARSGGESRNLLPSSSMGGTSSSIQTPIPNTPRNIPYSTTTPDPMALDHQQRWFTGWGDEPHPSFTSSKSLKTPSLGLIWTTQIACRIALIKKPVYGRGQIMEENETGEAILKRWRRWMKIVFAPWAAESSEGLAGAIEFQIKGGGICAVKAKENVDGEDV